MEQIEKKLVELFSIQSYLNEEKEMFDYIISQLSEIEGVEVSTDRYNNIFVTKGIAEYYTCVSAQIDTVHGIVDDFKIKIDNGLILPDSDSTGVGGDDKYGIYAVLELIKRCDTIKAVFFSGEESGFIGSRDCELKFFENVGLLIGIDRRNSGDLIVDNGGYSISYDFKNFLEPIAEKYNYKEAPGGRTDVFIIQGRLEESNEAISTFNMSCGYYNPHSRQEYVVISELLNSIDFCEEIIKNNKGVKWAL